MFDYYMTKQGSGGDGYDRSDEMSDLNIENYAMDDKSGDNGGLVVSKEGGNDLDFGIKGYTKRIEEVKELVRSDKQI